MISALFSDDRKLRVLNSESATYSLTDSLEKIIEFAPIPPKEPSVPSHEETYDKLLQYVKSSSINNEKSRSKLRAAGINTRKLKHTLDDSQSEEVLSEYLTHLIRDSHADNQDLTWMLKNAFDADELYAGDQGKTGPLNKSFTNYLQNRIAKNARKELKSLSSSNSDRQEVLLGRRVQRNATFASIYNLCEGESVFEKKLSAISKYSHNFGAKQQIKTSLDNSLSQYSVDSAYSKLLDYEADLNSLTSRQISSTAVRMLSKLSAKEIRSNLRDPTISAGEIKVLKDMVKSGSESNYFPSLAELHEQQSAKILAGKRDPSQSGRYAGENYSFKSSLKDFVTSKIHLDRFTGMKKLKSSLSKTKLSDAFNPLERLTRGIFMGAMKYSLKCDELRDRDAGTTSYFTYGSSRLF